MGLIITADRKTHYSALRAQILTFLTMATAVCVVLSCLASPPQGKLQLELIGPPPHVGIDSQKQALIEIYRGDRPQDTSSSPITLETYGRLAPGLSTWLPVGSYLILAHCSHQWITIQEQKTTTVKLHKVLFQKPQELAESSGVFHIQCQRYRQGVFPGHLQNTYELYMLSGQHSLFVNIKALNISIKEGNTPKPYALAAFRVPGATEKNTEGKHYFLSTDDHQLSLTRHISLGKWVFVWPGSYRASLHGTSHKIELNPGEIQELPLSYLHLQAPPNLSFKNFLAVHRTPYRASLKGVNSSYDLNINTTYPLFPGTFKLQLGFSNQPFEIKLSPHSLTNISLQALTINSSCKENQWTCLGKVDVSLYQGQQKTPLIKGASDIPLLYPKGKVKILLSTSAGLRKAFELTPPQRQKTLTLGTVVVQPSYKVSSQELTELVRIETLEDPPLGASLEMSSQKPTTLKLLPGKYALTSYLSYKNNPKSPYLKKKVRRELFYVQEQNTIHLTATFRGPPKKKK